MIKTIRTFLLTAVLLVCVALTGCQELHEANIKYQNAKAYIQGGDYKSAIPLLKECLDVSHEDPEIHYYLGKCYEETGQLTDAIWHLELAVRFDPSHRASQMALIRTLAKNGQKNKSLETARKFFSYHDAPFEELLAAGSRLLSYHLVDQAELAYEAALRKDPKNPEPYIRMADYYFMQGDETRGEDYLIKAFRVNPTWPGLGRRMGEKGLKTNIPVTEPTDKPLTPDRLEMNN